MNDMILKYAQSPDCILAVTPDRGGAWWSPLRPGEGNPWPSTTLRDFGNAQQMWEDFNLVQSAADLTHDYTFEIVFSNLPQLEKSIFYANAANALFGVYQFDTGRLTIFSNLLKDTSTSLNYISYSLNNAGSFLSGEHRAKMVIAGSTAKVFLDNSLVSEISGANIVRNVATTFSTPRSNGGSISLVTLTDDTTGKRLWSYPNEAERVRLLTKTNIRTDRGVFEAADPGQGWAVATALDLGGRLTPLTAVVFFTPGEEDGSSYQATHPLLTQGYRMSGAWQSVIFCLAYRKPTGSSSYVIELAAAFDESGGQNLKTVSKTLNSMTGRHCAGATWDPATGTCRLYLDGAMVAEAVWSDKAGLPFRADSSYPELNLHQSNASWQNFNDRIDAALVFSRVLSESEIAAMIPRREWVFEVEAGSISITTRGFQKQQWILPDGSISTAANLTGNVTAGTVICRYSGMDSYSRFDISASSSNPAMLNTVLNINNLPPVTADLRITGVAGLTGNAVDLPRVSTYFYLNGIDDFYADAADLPRPSDILLLQNCPNITGSFADLAQSLDCFYCTGTGLTGTTADIPRATNVLNLNNIPGLTGDAADLPLNSGGRIVIECPGITGALPVTATNTTVSYHTNNSVAPEEYDQTVQNVVDAGAINGTLGISKNRTSASDANIQLLRDRGWTVVDA